MEIVWPVCALISTSIFSAASCSARRRLEPEPWAEVLILGPLPAPDLHFAEHPEQLGVLLAFDPFDGIARKREAARLKVFLQAGFRILELIRRRERRNPGLEQGLHHPPGDVEPAVEEQRPDQRLQGVRQDGFAAETTGLELPGPEAQHIAYVQRRGDLRERLAADDPGAQPAQIAFGAVGKGAEQMFRDHEVQDRVAEKFQPLVVAARPRSDASARR